MRRYLRTIDPVLGGLIVVVGLPILACLLLIAGVEVSNAIALRPVAERLGTQPNKAAIVNYVMNLLEEHQGASRAEIHELLHNLDKDIIIRGGGQVGKTQTVENAYWMLAKPPWGLNVWISWGMFYDSEDRLIRVEPGSSFP